MNNYIIMVGRGIPVAVDILSESASSEIALQQQGFIIAYDSCKAESIEHALKTWQQQRDGTYGYEHVITSTTNVLAHDTRVIEVKALLPRQLWQG